MQDLQYIVGIGYSGADFPRAVILAFLFAMFARRDINVWQSGLFALLIDRTVWPFAAMGATGADPQAIMASFTAIFRTFVDDLGIYIVRYIGLVLMIGVFFTLRVGIHRALPGKAAA
ncbi:MAG: hypothetical protein AAGC77_00160 [Pseudomonadota bacterium]